MNPSILAAFQSATFFIVDLIIIIKSIPNCKKSKSQQIFVHYESTIAIIQFLTIIDQLMIARVFYPAKFFLIFFYSLFFSSFAFIGYYWFGYFLEIRNESDNSKRKLNLIKKIICIISVLITVTSNWTHAIFFVQEINGKSKYIVGSFYYLHLLPYVYCIIALVLLIKSCIQKKKNIKQQLKYIGLFTLPNIIGAFIQVFLNYDFGFTQIGISIGGLFIYLEMVIEEVKEIDRLKNIEELNKKLQDSNREQEFQLEKISSLNKQLKKSSEEISAAFGMIEGLSQEYHTIWRIDRETLKMRLLRSSGKNTIQEAVDIGFKYVDYWRFVQEYVKAFVVEQDRNRVLLELNPQVITNHIDNSKSTYSVNYLRKSPDGLIGYHQMTFVDASPEDGKKQFMLGFRDVDSVVKAETKNRKDFAEQLQIIQSMSKIYFSSFFINMENDTFYEISTIDAVRSKVGKKGNASSALNTFCEQMVSMDSIDELKDFVNLQTLNQRMKNKDVITLEYQGNTSGWSQLYFIAGERTDDGDLKSVFAASRTIHDEKEREQQIQRREKLQLLTISNAIHGGFKIGKNDLGYSFSYISEQLAAMCGYTVKEFWEASGGKMSGIVNLDDARRELPGALDSIAHGKMYTMNYRIKCKDGSWKNVEDRGYLIRNPGGEDEFWCFIVDRDELTAKTEALALAEKTNKALLESQTALKKAMEDAEAANSAKTSFLFNMSHDIRTPMNAIIGFTNLLEKNQEDKEKRSDYLRKIQESSVVLLSIINNVLEMARIEKGTIEINESVWSADQLNDSLYSVFFEMMKQKGIEYTRSIEVENKIVYCDPIKLREVFINILSNAYKYTNAGGKVKMELRELPCEKKGYALYQTKISDNGIGMSKDFIPHIFEEFTRENNSTENKIEGTGLGMPIVKRLLDLMGGTIEVESEKGKGTTITVRILHRIAEEKNLTEKTGVEVDSTNFVGKKILLAEDNDLNAEIAIAILNENGFIVERAVNGKDCVEKIEKSFSNYYDIILMDIQMPVMNGYDAAKKIRSIEDEKKSKIPIIAMTANAFEEDKREAVNCGMDAHVAKPINIRELLHELSRFLG